MIDQALISVILPVRNGMPYLQQAVDSVLRQSFSSFEFLIIDDGSTDQTGSFLSSLEDPRVRILKMNGVGLANALNYGIDRCRTPFLARMDADDICDPERFQHQYEYLASHRDCVVVGSQSKVIDENDQAIGVRRFPVTNAAIRWQLAFGCPFQHPVVMLRREALLAAGSYRQDEFPAEDHALWVRMSREGSLANLNRYLLSYRIHGESISSLKAEQQLDLCGTWSADYVANQLAGIDKVAFRELYLFLATGRLPDKTNVVDLVQAYRCWCDQFVNQKDDRELAEWIAQIHQRLRWHCLKHASQSWRRPRAAWRWVRLAGAFDPEHGSITSIAGRAARKVFRNR